MSKVKICGLSRLEDIDAVNLSLPDYIGFVFAPSRRRIDTDTAAGLKEKLDPRIKAVGVFVNANAEDIIRIYKNGIIDLAQLHGDEDDEYIKRLKKACGCPVIKTIGVSDTAPAVTNEPDYLLFDTLSVQRGGIGKAFDWDVLKEYHGLPYFLAGGINAGNVADALKSLAPFCVDTSSGVETNGVKDAEKIARFIHIVRSK